MWRVFGTSDPDLDVTSVRQVEGGILKRASDLLGREAFRTMAIPHTPTALALNDVGVERQLQDIQWGVSDHDPLVWAALIAKHAGRLTSNALDWLRWHNGGDDSEEAHSIFDLRARAIKVAALCVACVEGLDRAAWASPLSVAERERAAIRARAILQHRAPE